MQKIKLSVLHKYTAIGISLFLFLVFFLFLIFFFNFRGKITTCFNSLFVKYSNKLSNTLISCGLRVDTVSLEGNHFVSKEEILGLVDKSKSILLISLPEIKRRIELLSKWIKNVEIQRVLPDTIAISIEEYKPFAIWHHGNQFSVIDSTGYIIVNDYYIDGLVFIFGNNALSELAFIKVATNNETELSRQIHSFNYMQGWKVIFNNGLEARLPEKSPDSAWSCLTKLHSEIDIMKNNWKVIDLRIQNKIFIKKQKTYHQLQNISCNQ